jgi:hypothetical protein
MVKQTLHIQGKLHPEASDDEARAIEIWNGWMAEKHAPRSVLTWLILNAAGEQPQGIRRSEYRSLSSKIDRLTSLLEDGIGDLLKEIKRTDPQGFRDFANRDEEQDGDDLSAEFMANARKGARRTIRQIHGDDRDA